MGILVYVLGRSGTGKSFSMRDFKAGEIGVINVQGKILPFKGSGAFDVQNTDDSSDIVKSIKAMAKKYKTIVVDDFQYVMANEFMRRATERGYDKFTEIARHAWDIANVVRTLPNDTIVYIMCHTDTDQDGFEKLKTIGKLLDEKIVLEGMSTIVLKTAVSDGQYMFLTQNNGKDTVKSPAGMFPSYAIDNNLKYVDSKIRNYYELGEFLSDEDLKEIDEAVKHEDIPIKEEKKSRKTRKVTEESEAEEKPKRRSRKAAKEEEIKEKREEYIEKMDKAIEEAGGDAEEVPVENIETPEVEEVPKRKRRTKAVEPKIAESGSNDSENAENDDVKTADGSNEEKPRRRRRRA